MKPLQALLAGQNQVLFVDACIGRDMTVGLSAVQAMAVNNITPGSSNLITQLPAEASTLQDWSFIVN
jgi:hypothetical protein